MSRLKRYTHALASGYGALAANVLYSLASIPIAMHYLSNEEFGLWVLAAQISTYLALAELGMSGSIARILIDHKDHPDEGTYGAVIKTGTLVLIIQGIAVGLLGAILSIWLADLFDVPAKYLPTFRWLVGGQSAMLGLTFGTRIFAFVLQAHNRYDAGNYSLIGSFGLNLAVLWTGFSFGCGVYSLLVANAAALLFVALFTAIASRQLRLMPKRGCWGSINERIFRNLFGYAFDIFLLSIGQQLISTSQVFVVSRTIGLSAAAVWSVATKAFLLGQQTVWRILDFSGAAFSEMMARKETDRLKDRFRDVVILTASVSVIMGGAVALCNPSFLKIWTHGRISWPRSADLWMGVSVVVYSITRCFTGFIGLTKEIRSMKFIYLIEGASFVLFALIAARPFGFAGVIGAGVLTNLACSGAYGVARTDKYLSISSREMIFGWLKFPMRVLLVVIVVGMVLWLSTRALPPLAQLLLGAGLLAVIGAYSLWQFGLPPAFQKEISSLLVRVRQRWLPTR